MDISSWIQLILFVGLLLMLTNPFGAYLYRVLESKEKTIFSPFLGGCEKLLFKALGAETKKEQSWQQYGAALAIFSLVGMLLTYLILRLQHILPLNPQHFSAVEPSLAFNTAASFASNTNWQNYAGERTLSHFSQMVGLTFQNFVSAAVGIAVAAALDCQKKRPHNRQFLG
jgi:K+-transporting ATPase ATPase A chain